MRSRLHVMVRRTNRDPPRGLLAAACLLAVACGAESEGPTGPTPTTPGATASVSVTYPADHGTIYIGDQVQLEATVSSSGGGTQAAAGAVWTSDAPAVATVSPSGLVTAVSAAEASISAQAPAGGRGSLRLRVFPRFHGHWEGDLNVTRMTVPPDWRELGEEDCDGLPDCASWIPLEADFTQDGATVTGTVTSTFAAVPNYEWTIQSGTVSIDGTLTLTSDETAFRLPDGGVEIRARLMSWESQADSPGEMTGAAAVEYASDALSGNAVVEGCLEADNILRECSAWRRPGGGSTSRGARRGFLLRRGTGR